MLCPKCETDIGFARQAKEADEQYYDDVKPPVILMLMCDKCEETTVMISMDAVGGLEDVETPMGNVKFPVCTCEQGLLPCVTHGWNPRI